VVFYDSAEPARNAATAACTVGVDVTVVEIGQRAVLLEGVKERGVRTGQSELPSSRALAEV
jgi:hypothetical protein